MAARIFAIVDVWDALLSDRPYRKAWTEDEAKAHIKKQSGSHFDPKVVEAFFEMLKEMGGELYAGAKHQIEIESEKLLFS